MSTFAGMVHDHLAPTPIRLAEIDPVRLRIEYASWIFEAMSQDGFFYEGNYGEKRVDPERMLRCWVYSGPDGSKMVYCYWYHRKERQTQGESVFRLFPTNESQSRPVELPEEWDLARDAIMSRAEIAQSLSLELALVYDRWTGYRDREEMLKHHGVYFLFYASGKIARIGQANPRTLAQRLRDYESNSSGWFSYRWVAVIPVDANDVGIITPLENYLLATLKPPENDRGVSH